MPNDPYITLSPTGRVATICCGPSVNTEAARNPSMIPIHLLNRGDEPGLCVAHFRDRIRRGEHSGLVTLECLSQ